MKESIRNKLEEEYFDWLIEWIVTDDLEENDREYRLLLAHLYNTDFSEKTAKLIPNDDNRIEDGLEFRRKYDIEIGCYGTDSYEKSWSIDHILENKPCSLLEMLIGLALRIEDTMERDLFPTWFWIMLDNLGLMEMTNENYDEGHVDQVLDVFLNRKYSTDGHGGLFPLTKANTNQKKVEIWYQMSSYLVENYL